MKNMDLNARKEIIENLNTNLFVEAGAGSGKTTMLVERMVALVESGVPVSEIAAITFTRAAAREFFDRFRAILIERSKQKSFEKNSKNLPKTTKESRERCENALKDLKFAFLGTIDSFCQKLINEYPEQIGLPGKMILIENEELENYAKQYYFRILNGDYGDELKLKAEKFDKTNKSGEKNFIEEFSHFYDRRNVHYEYDGHFEKSMSIIFKKEKEQIHNLLSPLLTVNDEYYDKSKKENWENFKLYYKNLFTYDWDDDILSIISENKTSENKTNETYLDKIYNLIKIDNRPKSFDINGKEIKGASNIKLSFDIDLDKIGKAKELFYVGYEKGEEIKLISLKKEVIAEFENIKDNILNKFKDKFKALKTRYLLDLFVGKLKNGETLMTIFEKEMKEKGFITYFDALYYLRNALRDSASKGDNLIGTLSSYYNYYLIDECQDTNPLQNEIFFYLCGKNKSKKWYECIPKEGSLFIVGDPKQSIYRFRNANVTAYLQIKNLFNNKNYGKNLELPENFRSSNELKRYYNKCFTEVFPENTEIQAKFTDIPINKSEDTDENARKNLLEGAYYYDIKDSDIQKDYKEFIEKPELLNAEFLSDLVKKLVNNPDVKIKEKNEIRQIKYSDIMIITYKKKMSDLLSCFTKKKIPYRVDGETLHKQNEALLEVCKLYRALVKPTDVLSIYLALKGKLFNFSDADINRFLYDESCVLSLSKSNLEKLKKLKNKKTLPL